MVLHDRLDKVKSCLHFAPEAPVEKWLREVSDNYVSCDLEPGRAMTVEDVTKLSAADNTYDFIWCSHVLEHVPDDVQAMGELRRVLTNDGMCVVQVPIWRRETYEDFSITTPRERLAAFGQTDHVRLYGFDIKDRLERSGFRVEEVVVRDFDLREIGKHSLNHASSSELFLCYKH